MSTERTVYLCSGLHHPCYLVFSLFQTCIAHITEIHPDVDSLVAEHGNRALEALVHSAKLFLDASMPDATRIYVCSAPCRSYSLSLRDAITHVTEAHPALAAATIVDDGAQGLRTWITRTLARSITMEPTNGVLRVYGVGEAFSILFAADTMHGLAVLLAEKRGLDVLTWEGLMRAGQFLIRFEHQDRSSGVCRIRNDERVKQLRECMVFGTVEVNVEAE